MLLVVAHDPHHVQAWEKSDRYPNSVNRSHFVKPFELAGWDGETIVVAQTAKSDKFAAKVDKMSRSRDGPMTKQAKEETLPCSTAGCTRKFVNATELANHIEVVHSEREEVLPSLANTQEADTEDDLEAAGEATITQLLGHDGEETIIPIPWPMTEANLSALNSSISPDREGFLDALTPSEMSFETTYSVEDYDDLPLSDVAEQESPFIMLAVFMLLNLWKTCVSDYVKRSSSGVRQHAPYADDTSTHSSLLAYRESLSAASVQSSQVSGVKRKQPNDRDDDDDQRNNDRRNKQSKSDPDALRPLACPFNKFNNIAFGVNAINSSYHVCSTWSDVKTAYFKQHLIRTHCMPEFHCDRCGLDCRNSSALREHRRQNPPCELKELDSEKIVPEIQEQLALKSRNTIKTSREAYWERVFDAIFGREVRLSREITPYYTGPLSEDLNAFVRFSQVRLPEVISRSRERLGLNPAESSEQDSQFGAMILQEASQAYMAEMSSLRSVSSRKARRTRSAASSSESLAAETSNLNLQTPQMEKQLLAQESAHAAPWTAESSNSQPPDGLATLSRHSHIDTMNLSTRPSQHGDPTSQSAFDFQQPMSDFGEFSYVSQHFDNTPFLTEPEFADVIENGGLYGANSIPPSEFEGFHVVSNPSRKYRQGP